jgi:hypothetical protein
MHTATITQPDRAALENLWGDAGIWAADTWTRLNATHFDGRARYHGVVWGLTPHGHHLGHTSNPGGRITLHPALLDPQTDAWKIRDRLGTRFAADVLLHEMIHALLGDEGYAPTGRADEDSCHNNPRWCTEIVRITPQLQLPPIMAVPVKPRRVNGKVRREPLDGHLSRDAIARWPYSLRPAGFYTSEGRIRVPI